MTLIVLALAGCTSGLTAKRSSAVGGQTYNLVLTPLTSPGRRSAASVTASIVLPAVKGSLCWTFSKVTGVADPTLAHINTGQYPGSLVVQLGAHYAAHGCTKVPAATVTFLDNPSGANFLAIDTRNHPDALSASLVGQSESSS
jgi:hypothetical protein